MTSSTVKIFDTTLRDGEQAPGFSMNTEQKIRLAAQLDRLGVDVIEAGFPAASPDDFKAVQEIAKTVQNAEVCGLARATEKDIRTCWDAIKEAKKPRIHTFIATSPIHMEYKLKKTPEEVLKMAVESVKLAKSLCDRVDFSPEDGARSEPKFLYQVLEAVIEAGADTVNIPDTVGYYTPTEFGNLIKGIRENVPNIDKAIISTHCHNDLGLAVANSLEGVKNGARQVECTINGIGERAGNAALEEIVMILKTRKEIFQLETNINTTEIYPTSKLLTSITGISVQPNKAIVGMNAFAHESGIHQDGILKNRQTYEIMDAKDIGLDKNQLILGKHSGRHAVSNRLKELGVELDDEELNQFFSKFKSLADKKKQIFDEDLVLLLTNNNSEDSTWVITDLAINTGLHQEPTASISIKNNDNGKEFNTTSTGDGPINAIFEAINQITKIDSELIDYRVNSVSEGADAQGSVTIRIQMDGKVFSGSDNDTDILIASSKAYLNALNNSLKVQKITQHMV